MDITHHPLPLWLYRSIHRYNLHFITVRSYILYLPTSFFSLSLHSCIKLPSFFSYNTAKDYNNIPKITLSLMSDGFKEKVSQKFLPVTITNFLLASAIQQEPMLISSFSLSFRRPWKYGVPLRHFMIQESDIPHLCSPPPKRPMGNSKIVL